MVPLERMEGRMQYKEIKELIEIFEKTDLNDLEITMDNVSLRLNRSPAAAPAPAYGAPPVGAMPAPRVAAAAPAATAENQEEQPVPVLGMPVEKPEENVVKADSPVGNSPIASSPIVNNPIANSPIVNNPVVNSSILNDLVANSPILNNPAANSPIVNNPVGNSPIVNSPATEGTLIKAPIVGTFYASSAPDKPPFVKVGDRVEEDDILCIIEAMKFMNEVPSERGGTIAEILVKDGDFVEFGQPLFRIV